MASDGDLTDVKHRAYGLILRYGTAALRASLDADDRGDAALEASSA